MKSGTLNSLSFTASLASYQSHPPKSSSPKGHPICPLTPTAGFCALSETWSKGDLKKAAWPKEKKPNNHPQLKHQTQQRSSCPALL